MKDNEQLLRKVFEVAAQLGQVPIALMGDFNVVPDRSRTICTAISCGGWTDAALAVARAENKQPCATCFVRDTSEGSRIDLVLLNNVLSHALTTCGVVGGTGLPTHVPVAAVLALPALDMDVQCLVKPRSVPLDWCDPDLDAEQHVSDTVARAIIDSNSQAWLQYLADGDVAAAFSLWCKMSEKYLFERARMCGSHVHEKACSGRGHVKVQKRRRQAPCYNKQQGAESTHTRKVLKLCRQVEALSRQWQARRAQNQLHVGSLPYRMYHLWRKVQSTGACLLGDDTFSGYWSRAHPFESDTLQQLGQHLRNKAAALQQQDRQDRLKCWREAMVADAGNGGAKVASWCKMTDNQRVNMISRPDGSYTANSEEMHKLILDAWLPIFRMFEHEPPASWSEFEKEFGAFFPPCNRAPAVDLTGDALRRAFHRMRLTSAAGADGWRVAELRALPTSLLNLLADVLGLIETTGNWPVALSSGLVSLIDKGEGASPTKLRPIGVMSAIYRAWASVRVRDLALWQRSWIDDSLHVYRAGHAPEDVWWQMALHIEQSLLTGDDLTGFVLDWSKCFDRVPIEIVLKLAEHMGMPAGVHSALAGMYRSLRRRFRLSGHVGPSFASTNGIIQGCPLSVLLLNALMNVWASAIRSRAPSVKPAVFADDAGGYSPCSEDVQQALDVTGRFATVTKQKLNVDKSKVWSTAGSSAHLHGLSLGGGALQQTTGTRVVGAHLRFRVGERNVTGEDRVAKGIAIAKRIRWTPLPMFLRVRMVASLVNPGALYAFPASGLPQQFLNSLRSAVTSAIWGTQRKLRCRELVLTLLAPGHVVDPMQCAGYNALCTLRRMMLQRPDLHESFVGAWRVRSQMPSCSRVPGPIGVICALVKKLEWTWDEPFAFTRPGKRLLPLLQCDESWWKHEVRQGLRLVEWRRAAARRADCKGLDTVAGVDKLATCGLLSSGKLGASEIGDLRSILCGSIRFGARLCEAGIWDSALCPFCGLEEETSRHVWWHCPAWQHLRFDPDLPSEATRRQWPECTQCLGVMLEDLQLHEFQQQQVPGANVSSDVPRDVGSVPACADETRDTSTEIWDLGCIVAWTDGACKNNQDSRLRRAGAGVFFACNHERNRSFALPGECQTNQRAELYAVVKLLQIEDRPLEIRTDSQWVLDGALSWNLWRAQGWQGDHSDLWLQLSSLLSTRQSPVKFSKVKGHASQTDIRRGDVISLDKWGNDGADSLAVFASASHCAPAALVQKAQQRKTTAKAVHKMMLSIVRHRRAAEEQFAVRSGDFEEADRGSDIDTPSGLS